MTTYACDKEFELDVVELSDENIIEGYITALLKMADKNYKLLENELLKRRLFLVALERYDRKKTFFHSGFSD
ncbi:MULTISPECIES: hypothetical protein [Neobacillus]|uniref:Uncharacterized protein n=1 Tax=Neobacillus rhizophilus TaxID=2833579 RepID=A0A942U5R4_9BACI|nr:MULTISPECIES: hypothetical protein [Neobacillus]MBS4215230.1 hypothetical protein [Neobacillus rhizophilus]